MSLDAAIGMDTGNRPDHGDVANYKATASESAPNSAPFTNISAADAFEVTVSSTRFLADANYRMEGDDLIISGANGEGYRLLGWMSAELQPGFIAEDGGVLEPELIATLANNGSEQGVATAQMSGSGLAVQIGTVDNISGEVFAARSGGELIALKAGDPVYQDDEIITGIDGVIGFVFADESTFSIGEDARMIIDEFVYDPETASGSIDVNILKGAFTFASGLIADANPTNMVMTTPQAVIGIRGTAGGGFVNPDGESEFFNTEGAISITTDAGVAIIDRPLETTRVQSRNEPPSEPELSNAQNLASKFSKVLEASPSPSASTELILDAGEALDSNDEARDEDAQEEENAAQAAEEVAEEGPTEELTEEDVEDAEKEIVEESEDASLESSVSLGQAYLIEVSDTVQESTVSSEPETKELSRTNLAGNTSVSDVNTNNEGTSLLPTPSGNGTFSIGDGSITSEDVKSVALSGEANSVYAGSDVTIVLSDSYGNTKTITTTAKTDGSFSVNADMSSFLGGDISASLKAQAATGQILENTAVAFMQTVSVTSYSESNTVLTSFSDGDGLTKTNLSNQEITGTGLPDSKVVVTLTGDNNETYSTEPLTVNNDGVWSTKNAAWNGDVNASGDASYTVSVASLDESGNAGEFVKASKNLTIDATAPTTGVTINSIISDDGTPDTDFITNDTNGLTVRATLSAALEDGEVLEYSTDGTHWIDITSATSGTSVAYTDNALTDTKTVQMRVTDAAGNSGPAATQLVTIDVTALTGVTINSITNDNGISNTDFITNDANGLTVSATLGAALEAGEVLEYSTDGINWIDITSSVSSGTSVSYADVNLTDTKTIQMRVTDAAGNSGPAATQLVTIDTSITAAPNGTHTVTISNDTGGSATDRVTSDQDVKVTLNFANSLALASDETLQVSADDGQHWVPLTGSGTDWSTADDAVTLLSGSSKAITARIIDMAGNETSLSLSDNGYILETDVQTEIPSGSITVSINDGNDTGASDSDLITNEANVKVTLTFENGLSLWNNGASGESLQISVDGSSWTPLYDSSPNSDGTVWTMSNSTAAFTLNGAGTFSVQLVSINGAATVAVPLENPNYILDTTSPSGVTIDSISDDTGASSADFITNDANGLTVSVTLNEVLGDGEVLEYSGDNGASWVSVPTNTISGTSVIFTDINLTSSATIQMRVTDAAGNSSSVVSQLVTIDTQAPDLDLSLSIMTPHQIGEEVFAGSASSAVNLISKADPITDSSDISKITLIASRLETGDILSLEGMNLLNGNSSSVTVSGEVVNYTFSDGTITLSGDWTSAQANIILSSLSFKASASSLNSRRFDITVEDVAGNASNVATSVVRVKEELSIDAGWRGEQSAPPLVLATSFESDRSTYIVGPDVNVTGMADNITLSVTSQEDLSDDLLVVVDPSTQDHLTLDASLTSIGYVSVQVAIDSATGEITISGEGGGPLSGDQIELILSHISYDLGMWNQPNNNTTATVEVKLSADVSLQSEIEIIGGDTAHHFRISEEIPRQSTQYGRVVSGTDAESGVAISENAGISTSYVSTQNQVQCTLTLHGFKEGDQLYLSQSNYVFYEQGSGVPASVLSSGIDSGNGVSPLGVGRGLISFSYDENTQTLSFEFKDTTGTSTTHPYEVESLLNHIYLKTSDDEGGRAIEIEIELEYGSLNFQPITSVFEVSSLPISAPVEFEINTSEGEILELDVVTAKIAEGYDSFIGSDNYEQVFELDELKDGIQYIGGSGDGDELEFQTETTGLGNRVIDLSSIDKITGKVEGFEIIDLSSNGTTDTLKLNSEAVAGLSDKTDTANGKIVLQVTADSGDRVDLGGEFSQASTQAGVPNGYTAYESEDAIVHISTDTSITGLQGG